MPIISSESALNILAQIENQVDKVTEITYESTPYGKRPLTYKRYSNTYDSSNALYEDLTYPPVSPDTLGMVMNRSWRWEIR